MSKVLSLRVPDDLADWVDKYAAARGVTRQALIEEGLRSFMEDCERGVPEIRRRAREQSTVARRVQEGVGTCPKSKVGHVWERVDGQRVCSFCGVSGKFFLAAASADRRELFSGLRAPMTSGSGKPPGGKAA